MSPRTPRRPPGSTRPSAREPAAAGPASVVASVRRAAREVLDPAHVRAAMRVAPADATLAAALRCGASVAIALVLCAAVGRKDLAGFAALAALASLYGRYEPYRRRSALLALVGAVFVGVIVLTTLVAALEAAVVASLVVVAVVAAGATALCLLLSTGPPGGTIVVFAAGAGLAGAPTPADALARGAAACVGALVAWLVCCAGYTVRPSGPARLAVARAGRAVARASAVPDGAAERAAATVALGRASTVLADDASHARTRAVAHTLRADVAALERRLAPHGAHPATVGRTGGGVEDGRDPVRHTLRAVAAAAVRRSGWRLPTLRVLVAALGAATAAQVAGFGHPAWAAMGATATLQGPSAGHVATRGLQRATGTVVGALLAWPLLLTGPSFWTIVALVVVLQVVTELVVGRHYGVAMLTITPMALLMTSLGSPDDPAALALDRAADTVLGAVVALVVVVLLTEHHGARRGAGSRS